mgnify:CR=1 FL=1
MSNRQSLVLDIPGIGRAACGDWAGRNRQPADGGGFRMASHDLATPAGRPPVRLVLSQARLAGRPVLTGAGYFPQTHQPTDPSAGDVLYLSGHDMES